MVIRRPNPDCENFPYLSGRRNRESMQHSQAIESKDSLALKLMSCRSLSGGLWWCVSDHSGGIYR